MHAFVFNSVKNWKKHNQNTIEKEMLAIGSSIEQRQGLIGGYKNNCPIKLQKPFRRACKFRQT